MRIIVMSDSHGNYSSVESIVQRNTDADMFIHLGDGAKEIFTVTAKYPELKPRFVQVKGNCDFSSILPDTQIIQAGTHRIFAAHGHTLNVKLSFGNIMAAASVNECDIILFGHTHCRYMHYEGGVYMMNPGSCSCPHDGNKPSFGCINITDSGVVMNIADV